MADEADRSKVGSRSLPETVGYGRSPSKISGPERTIWFVSRSLTDYVSCLFADKRFSEHAGESNADGTQARPKQRPAQTHPYFAEH